VRKYYRSFLRVRRNQPFGAAIPSRHIFLNHIRNLYAALPHFSSAIFASLRSLLISPLRPEANEVVVAPPNVAAHPPDKSPSYEPSGIQWARTRSSTFDVGTGPAGLGHPTAGRVAPPRLSFVGEVLGSSAGISHHRYVFLSAVLSCRRQPFRARRARFVPLRYPDGGEQFRW